MHTFRPRHRSLCAALLLLAAPALAAEPRPAPPADDGRGWREAQPPDRFFRVEIPGPFEPFSDATELEGGLKGRIDGVRATLPGAFGGSNIYVASCVVAKDPRSAEERARAGMEHWQKLKPLHYMKPVKLGDVPGYEFQLNDDLKVIRSQVWGFADRTCTLLMHWRPFSKPPDPEITRFFGSFQPTRR
jgi:hypothetical protein